MQGRGFTVEEEEMGDKSGNAFPLLPFRPFRPFTGFPCPSLFLSRDTSEGQNQRMERMVSLSFSPSSTSPSFLRIAREREIVSNWTGTSLSFSPASCDSLAVYHHPKYTADDMRVPFLPIHTHGQSKSGEGCRRPIV